MKKSLICLLLCFALLLPLFAVAEKQDDVLYPARFGELWGYINRQGETVIEPQWTHCNEFRGDYAMVSVPGNDEDGMSLNGIIDKSGAYVVEPIYSMDDGYDGSLYGGRDTGVIWAMDDENRMGFFNIPNGFFTGMIYGSDVHPWVGSGRLVTYCDDELYGYIDRTNGKIVIPCQYEEQPAHFEGKYGRVPLYVEEGMDFTLIDETGTPYAPPAGTALYGFSFGDGLVAVRDEATGLCGYANEAGELAIPAMLEDAADFSEGFAAIKQDGLWGYIRTDGSVLCEPKYDCNRSYAFVNGLAVMSLMDSSTVVLDGSGNEVFRMENTLCSPFADSGVAMFSAANAVSEEAYGDWEPAGFVKRDGTVIVKVEDGYLFERSYADGYEDYFAEGYQALVKGDKLGFLDMEGNVAVDFTWMRAYNFRNGLARVFDTNDKMAYVDYTGAVVWSEP